MSTGGDETLRADALEALAWEQQMGRFLQSPAFPLMQAGSALECGQVISARFEIVRKLGEGGMGLVYEALDRKRGQRVALKLAKANSSGRLPSELESALRLRHRNICLVNEVHTAQLRGAEIDFLSMELIEGETLAAHLAARGLFDHRDACEIARQLCAGLAEAHRCGIIHRDLKAANVMLTRDEQGPRAVIMDFGLSGPSDGSVALWGTPRYMAPELWQGEQTSAASDLYALGVILFEMVRRSPPSTCSATTSTSQMALTDLPVVYRKLLSGCLSLEPAVRDRAFRRALQPAYWQPAALTRRHVLSFSAVALSAITAGAWFKREQISDLWHPLPAKRFVALVADHSVADPLTKPLLNSVIDTMENELSRAEANDHSFFVAAAHSSAQTLSEVSAGLGANLALQISGHASGNRFVLLLSLFEAKTGKLLRRKQLTCETERIVSLGQNAVRAAAALLNVPDEALAQHDATPPTGSLQAFRAFQVGQQWRAKPNDDGLEQAIDSYKAAVDADPHFALAYARLALAYSRLYALKSDPGALELAEENARAALRLSASLAEGYLALAYVFEKRGRQEKALAEIGNALARDPTDPRIILWQAQIYARFHRWNEAEQTFRRLTAMRPNYWTAYNDLGYVLDQQGKYPQALEAFQAATVAAPYSAMAFGNLGEQFFKQGNLEKARQCFEKSVRLKPNGLAYFNLADVWLALGNFPEAVTCCLQAVELDPPDDTNWLMLGDSYHAWGRHESEALKAYARATEEAERRLRADPSDGGACISLALYLKKIHSKRDVGALVAKADKLGLNDLDSQIAKARVLELLGRRREAVATLAQCFERGATRFEIETVRDFASLRNDPAYLRIPPRKGAEN